MTEQAQRGAAANEQLRRERGLLEREAATLREQATIDLGVRSATEGRMQQAVEEVRSSLSETVEKHSVQVAALQKLGQEDSGVKQTVQSIIYDIEREAQAEIGRWRAENSRLVAELVALR